MAGVHEHLIKHLDWDGEGKLLDTDAATALTVVRQHFKAQITAMDHWGVEWNYAKSSARKMQRLKGVADHRFSKGDAAKLDFPMEHLMQ